MTASSPSNDENNFFPLTLSLSRLGRGKFIRGFNLYPLPLDGGRARVGVKLSIF